MGEIDVRGHGVRVRRLLAVATALLALAGCAESEARVNSPDRIVLGRTGDYEALAAAAKAHLPTLPADTRRWSRGVVIGEALPDDEWAIRVLTRRGVLVLSSPWGCTEYLDEDQWQLLTDPGDAIRWRWTDTEVCRGDIIVTEVAAVRSGRSTEGGDNG